MNRSALALGVALAVAAVSAVPATAQTRVSVMLGFALPRPAVSGVIVVGPPYGYDAGPEVVVVPAPRRYRYRHPYGWERRDDRYHEDRYYREDKYYRHHRRHRDDREYDDEGGDE
jgi:hypothetical protein